MPAFSGVFMSNQVRDCFETEMDQDSDRDGASTIFEEAESISIGEVMKSPIFSEDESSDNSYWIDLGQSPFGSDLSDQHTRHKTVSPLPPTWFSRRKINKIFFPKVTPKPPKSLIYDDDKRANLRVHEDPGLSFDAAVLSVSHEPDRVKGISEEEMFAKTDAASRNGREIQEPEMNQKIVPSEERTGPGCWAYGLGLRRDGDAYVVEGVAATPPAHGVAGVLRFRRHVVTVMDLTLIAAVVPPLAA
ncbi:hypothetical protein EV1_039942 [Malus domestica]